MVKTAISARLACFRIESVPANAMTALHVAVESLEGSWPGLTAALFVVALRSRWFAPKQ